MKSTILASVLCAVLLSAVEASPSAHHKSLLSFRSRHASHKRHIALTSSSAQSKMIKKRKTPGGGDVVAEPANLAQGSYTSKQGCAIWHTVGEGEVCLGLIDKSSSGFNLDKFLQFNPSLNKACSNLEVGQAYCVDTVAGNAAAPKANTSSDKKTDVTPAKSLLLVVTNLKLMFPSLLLLTLMKKIAKTKKMTLLPMRTMKTAKTKKMILLTP